MNRSSTDKSVPAFVKDPLAALQRAATIARQIGIDSGTGIVIVERGRIVHKSPEELRREMAAEDRSVAADPSDP